MADEKEDSVLQTCLGDKLPKPADRTVYNMGIQERENRHMMTGPLLYNIINQSVIGRTCITQLKQEVFRRGYIWGKGIRSKM